eukprot:CAMPEP_0205806778 /NCGR_PEP_ID=MMETSP0205-20121125/10415_1 /ASSEMBLY_ACC=CAM_ASM_000278 /TAXON_ID=36767 /ORGANISM="Euplotes focardii, Strain TN1" /LENGTH=271 /DNA_ID=CAMNT_0053080163 /DNA_START=113 /DNA_END=926 /DNA_ORIENTATION=-
MVWRNEYQDTLKMTTSYADKPVELGNFLHLRTREREILYNRIHKKADTVKYDNFYTTGGDAKTLKRIEDELDHGFSSLMEILTVIHSKEDFNHPVSFAANALYALEKNGLRNEKMYRKVLYPILKNKAEYLHAEGIAGAIWAISQSQSAKGDLVLELLKNYEEKKFGTDIVYVNNTKFSNETFVSAEGTHGIEFDSTAELTKMYLQDHIVCLELFEGLKNLSNQSLGSEASSRVAEVLTDLESRQKITSDYTGIISRSQAEQELYQQLLPK